MPTNTEREKGERAWQDWLHSIRGTTYSDADDLHKAALLWGRESRDGEFNQFTDDVAKATKDILDGVDKTVAAAVAGERERCAGIALEQRCERNTPWDRACTTIAAAIRQQPKGDKNADQ